MDSNKEKISTTGKIIIFVIILPILFLLLITLPLLLILGPGLILAGSFILTLKMQSNAVRVSWEINNNRLHIKYLTDSAGLDISALSIGLVEVNGEWEPLKQIDNTSQELYRLKNNKQALVLCELDYTQYLVITIRELYYLIGHPNVRKLYEELLRLGAQEMKCEGQE